MYTAGGNVNDATTVENSMQAPGKTKNRTTTWSSNSTPGYIPERVKTLVQRHMTPMLTAALFTAARVWKQSKCPSTGKWIKMWSVYKMKYYLATKKISAICSNVDGPRECYA